MQSPAEKNSDSTGNPLDYLDVLREGMTALNAAGPDGFEGLIAEVLTHACGRPFRLAASGSQGGRDGDDGTVYFEAKRYASDLKRPAVSDKLLELSVRGVEHIDLFVLAVTCPVSAQHAEFYAKACDDIGIELLLLDWDESSLGTPTLAVLLSLATEVTRRFFEENLPDKAERIAGALSGLESKVDSRLPAEMLSKLTSPLASFSYARESSEKWFKKIFASVRDARGILHQPVAPFDSNAGNYRARPALATELAVALTSAPDEGFWMLQGCEGAGKTWLLASTWNELARPPILVFILPEECRDPARLYDLEGFVANKLAMQSEQTIHGDALKRWRRRLKTWETSSQAKRVRLVVYLDGINQSPDVNWRQWIESLSAYVQSIGGRLIVSARPETAQRLGETVASPCRRLNVPEWSEQELSEILKSLEIDPTQMTSQVFAALRNPRLLGIALEVLDKREINGLEELNPERLLFEYMNKACRDSAVQLEPRKFAQTLQRLAAEFIRRINVNQTDDLHVYSTEFPVGLSAAADSQFFQPVPWESNHYAIHRNGLSLALGLWIVSELDKAIRNNRDPAEHLERLIEPIEALDFTADAMLAAVMVAFLDTAKDPKVGAVLFCRYCNLQNRPSSEEAALMGLARRRTGLVLDAAEVSIEKGHSPDGGLIGATLSAIRDDSQAWTTMHERIAAWLTLRSDVVDDIGGVDQAEKKLRVQSRQKEYQERLRNLSQAERAILDEVNGVCISRDVKPYHSLAFLLMRGRELAPFAQHMVAWSLGTSLLSSFYSLHDEFLQLVQHNTEDWVNTRGAILRASSRLREPEVSEKGKWALWRLLTSTGALLDSAEAKALYDELTQSDGPRESWSLREKMCAVDPCDPTTAIPANLAETATKFVDVKPDDLYVLMGQTAEQYFFKNAATGICRFMPELASKKYRELIADVLTRDKLPLRQGIQPLLGASALIEPSLFPALTKIAIECSANEASRGLNNQDAPFVQHYATEAVLPHLDGNEQFALFQNCANTGIARHAVEMLNAAEEGVIERDWKRIKDGGDTTKLCNALLFIAYSNTSLPRAFEESLPQLVCHSDWLIRAHALAAVARTEDPGLVQIVVDSDWSASTLHNRREALEGHAGSRVLAAACRLKMIEPNAALQRMALSSYGLIARCGAEGIAAVAAAVAGALQRVLNLNYAPNLAAIEEREVRDFDLLPPLLSSRIPNERSRNPLEPMTEDENEKAWDAWQDAVWTSYFALESKLSDDDAKLALDHLSQDCVEAIVLAAPVVAETWLGWIGTAGPTQQRLIAHFWQQLVMGFAHVRKDAKPLLALVHLQPLTNVVRSYHGISVFTWLLWRSADLPDVSQICFDRLNLAQSDTEIAYEVYAAESAEQGRALDDYIAQQLAVGEPVNLCRALTVAGFRDEWPQSVRLLEQYAEATGMVGEAREAAWQAYQRNRWARHWFDLMQRAPSKEDFWRQSRLFLKITDARYQMWPLSSDAASPFAQFFVTLHAELNDRLEKWSRSRRDKLYGQKRPWWLH
ncbi:hypothetical protein [Massilia sp. YIM B04103]|uniref:hypothetical protein n=1 Tax=Massilia sp. YIM B04103 TaxID=2963106 RepID=UPI00210BCD79|nr:hypothetical protein [Massilia sp. YIM B04103]